MTELRSTPEPPRAHTPIPKFKYLNDPARYERDYAHRQTPFEGDFCVVSIDHVASVAHLGHEAMEVAKRIPSGRYVAYIGMSQSLPFEWRPSNPFTIVPVCQGIPPQSTYSDETPACIPILPNKDYFGGRQPLEAAAPFPWLDCYISTFTAKSCRVTTAKRDYSQVLSVLPDLVNARVDRLTLQDKEVFLALDERRKRGDPEVLARMPPSEFSSVESSADPLSFLPPTSACPSETVHSEAGCTTSVDGTHTADASTEEFPPFDPADFPPDKAAYGLLASVLFQPLNTNLPVVNIWYDLDMVSEVRDPQLFVAECEMLDKVIAYFHPEQCSARASAANKAQAEVESHEGTDAASAPTNTIAAEETASPPIVPVESEVVSLNTASPNEPTSPSATTLSREAISPRSSSPTTIFTDEPQAATRPEESRRSVPRRAATTLPVVSFASSTASTTEPVTLARTSSRRSVHRSTSRTSLRSVISASSASPTKREFPKHPHPYERSTRSSASTISYAVPRPHHDSLKSLRKSRSSSSLKAPRHSTVTLPARSLK